MPPRRRGAHATDGEDAIECNQLNQLQQQVHLQMQQQLDKSGQDNETEGWTTVGKIKSRGKMINQQSGNSQSGNKEVVVEALIDGSFSPFVDEEIVDDSFDSIWRMIEKRNEVNCDMGYVKVDRALGRNMEDDDFVDDIGKDPADRYARKVFDEMGERDIVSWNPVLELEKAYPAGIVYSTGSQVRGQETTVLTAITQLVHHGLIFVPIGYSFGAGMFEMEIVKGGSPNGARTIAGDGSRQPTTLELEKAFHQGKDIAAITKKCQGISQEVNLCHSFIGLRLLVYDDRQILVDMMGSYFTRDTILKYCDVSVHGSVYINGFESNVFVSKVVVAVYNRWGTLKGTRKMFDEMTMRSVYDVMSWNSIIPSAVRNGEYWVALNLFWRMCRESVLPNSFTFSSVFTACSELEELETGKRIQGWVIKCRAEDAFVCTAIVDLYAKYGDMEEAVKEFSCMPERNVVSWTAIISGFVQKDDSTTALAFFKVMRNESVRINSFTLTSVITACAKPNMITEAMQIHSLVLKSFFFMYPVIGSALLNFNSKLRDIDLSEMVFKEVGYVKTPGILAAMISSSAQNQNSKRTIELYQRMLRDGLRPDTFCSSSVLSVIDRLGFGKQLHGYILKTGLLFDVLVSSSLFTMYSKCGSLYDSFEVFKQISGRDNVSWASMIAGFTEHGYVNHVVQLFRGMLSEETRPDLMHALATEMGLESDLSVGSSLITMYSKSGSMENCRKAFDRISKSDLISWSGPIEDTAGFRFQYDIDVQSNVDLDNSKPESEGEIETETEPENDSCVGLDVARYLWDKNPYLKDQYAVELSRWFRRKPEWKKMSGRD